MKTLSEIGHAIRSRGGKVGQVKLTTHLEQFVPEYSRGKYKFYSDADAKKTISFFLEEKKQETKTLIPIEDRLDNIERLLMQLIGEKK